ncbi:MAG: carbamoyl phosphate synthase small subunit, partial [Candidatus Limnocylindrales bacterium]
MVGSAIPVGPARSLQPPRPLASSIVDPRIGDHGPALLALADGTVFPGIAFGAPLAAGGDLVVNTSQTGYQEVCTDPYYAGQVVVMTYPLIGNHGRIRFDDQSERPWLRALVVANATAAVLEDARQLATLLREAGIPAIAGIDTRALARHLRAHGSIPGLVTAPGEVEPAAAIAAARSLPRWEDEDFVGLVSPARITDLGEPGDGGPLIGIVDLGLKANIVRSLRRRGARVRILPHSVGPEVALADDIDGLVLSPGPGDPARLAGPVALARAALDSGRPLLGICLGHQIIGRAAGAETGRLRFGHHGANHPV